MYILGAQPAANYTSTDIAQGRGFSVQDEVADFQGNIYRFAQASGTIAQFDCVAINSAGVAQAITSTLASAGGIVGVAQAALSSGEFGFVQVLGVSSLNVLSTCSAGVALFTSGTAGKLDDTTTSQVKIAGVQILANVTAATATTAIIGTRPFAAL